MHGLPHTCSHCSKCFKRAEHLSRHIRTHTREKPYRCRCGAAFTRRDLLTRHWRITQHAGGASVTEHAPTAEAAITDIAQQTISSHSHGPNSIEFLVNGALDPIPGAAHGEDQDQLNVQAHAASFQDTQVVLNNQQLQSSPYHDEGLEDFRDFVNFIDGVGLSAQWTPEYDFDWVRIGDQVQASRRASREPERPRSPESEDIGTPFSTWLPSAPADDQVHLRSHASDDDRGGRSRSGTYTVTEDHRDFLVSLLAGLAQPITDFEIPSRHTLTRYITAFFGGFHSHFPFIHAPTYKPTCSPLELTLAMCATGAQYCFERRSSERLFRVARAILFDRLQQEQSYFGAQTLAFVAAANSGSGCPNEPPTVRRSGPWSPLDAAKTLLILVGFATWERPDLLQQAFSLRGLLVQILRDIGLKEEQCEAQGSTSRAAMWDHWIQRESARRTKLVAFCYINVHSIAYNIHPVLWSSELHLRLPCCTAEWQASSAAQWSTLQRDGKEDQMLFQTALSTLLEASASTTSVHPIPSPIGNYILLHSLLQRIHIVREISFSAPISPTELSAISRALRSWTSLWQQTPESILDPNNESGPIPFTSSALLVVAYIRLSLNMGPHRHLDSRNPDTIATALTNLPAIERNDNLLSALLYSTHALSIPVRLGIDRVARSQAFFWSVQHAVSSFECAIFLSKWLCSLPRPFHDSAISRSEHRILHWVRCIIKEAYSVTDFDGEDAAPDICVPEEPFELGTAVLRIWGRFLKGNTQWSFVVDLGRSLEGYMLGLAGGG
ncbi:C2H2 transcription factor-like protein [Paraphoma chrysanthemicola]|nr:C2H2 transcription factor-like protein [Paraphoma chrysanthemicola]